MILRRELWERSGHWDNYKENMYFTEIDEQPYAVKPMNCPGGLLIYKSRRRSYRDLPLRMAELGRVHRHEMSGVLHGLFRVRYFTQDDAHIYCTPEQLEDEVLGVVRFMQHIYAAFGFTDVKIELSTRPDKSIGSDEVWAARRGRPARVLEAEGIDYVLNPGDGAFYGPKIDFHIRDVMGRTWQCGTIQVDFAMPERLDITYTGADNEEHRPVMIHRACWAASSASWASCSSTTAATCRPGWRRSRCSCCRSATATPDYARASVRATRCAPPARRRSPQGLDDRGESVGKRIRDASCRRCRTCSWSATARRRRAPSSVRERGEDTGARPLAEFVDEVVAEVRRAAAAGGGVEEAL